MRKEVHTRLSAALVVLTRYVAAAPTTVAAIATEAAVSTSAEDTADLLLPCLWDFSGRLEIR